MEKLSGQGRGKISNFLMKYTMVIALVVVFLLFAVLTGGKNLLPLNMSNVLLQNAYVFVLACGMLLCILTGGNIDLSVGAVVCLVGAMAAKMLTSGGPMSNTWVVIAVCMLTAAVIGIWQGFWIGFIRIPPFIVTLAGMFIWRGVARLILDSKSINITKMEDFVNVFMKYVEIPALDSGDVMMSAYLIAGVLIVAMFALAIRSRMRKIAHHYDVEPLYAMLLRNVVIAAALLFYFSKLANAKGVSFMLLWVIAIALIYHFITSKTAFGRWFYAFGGNEKATKLSGINTNRVLFSAYLNMAVLAGLTGLMVLARKGSIDGDTGTSYEMDAIGSCFIGGASAYGGVGTIVGVLIGATLMGVINQGMNIAGLNSHWQYVVKGGVLLFAVIFDVLSNRKSGR